MKIHSVGAKLFHADKWTSDRQTDMKLVNVFCNFVIMLEYCISQS